MKTKAILGIIVVVVVVASAITYISWSTQPVERAEVKFMWNWLVSSPTAAYLYIPIEKGYYEEEGLDVIMTGGRGVATTTAALEANEVDIACPSAITTVLATERGYDIIMVAQRERDGGHGIIYRKDKGISEIKDLEGKAISGATGSAEANLFPGWAAINGIDPATVTIREVDPAMRIPILVAGDVDAMFGPGSYVPQIRASAGLDIGFWNYADTGLQLYGNGYAARSTYIEENPDVVRRFLRAHLRGIKYALENPEEAMQAFYKHVPEANPGDNEQQHQVNLAQADYYLGLFYDDVTAEKGLGWADEAPWQNVFEYTAGLYDLDIDFLGIILLSHCRIVT